MNTSNNQKRSFKDLLDYLQEQSWQLELLISGFAIFGLFQAMEPLTIAGKLAAEEDKTTLVMFYGILYGAVYILSFNLVLHVILRGIWIGTLGLRYVSGEIDFNRLNYTPKFTQFLKKKVVSFDHYIATLENICSLMFALTFLLVFYLLSFFIFFITFRILALFTQLIELPKTVSIIIVLLILIPYIIGLLLMIIDFFGMGILKKKKWTSKFYFSIYRVFSILTLSFLYRPLVYNFLDHKFSKRMFLFSILTYSTLAVLSGFTYVRSNYLATENESSYNFSNENNYEDLMTEKTDFIDNASIQSKVIKTNYLKTFVVYKEATEEAVFKLNQSLEPANNKLGDLEFRLIRINEEEVNIENTVSKYLKTLNKLYKLKIDNHEYKSDFIVTTNKRNRLGFETFLDIDSLSKGKHILEIIGLKVEEDSLVNDTVAIIPFWYFPQN